MSHRLTVRILLVGILALLILVISCTPSGPVVRIESPVSSVKSNNTVQVSIKVEKIVDLIAFEAHLFFDANVLEVLELNEGEFISADFVVQNTFDNAAGTIDYAVTQIDRPPVNGNGTLFVVVFQTKTPGQSPIIFRETRAAPAGMLLSDSNGTAIQVSLISWRIDVGE